MRSAARDVPEVLTEFNAHEMGRGGWEHTSRTTHTYVSLLRHLSTHYVQQRGPELGPYLRIERSYDGQNRPLVTRYDYWYDGAFNPSWRSQNSYAGSAIVPSTVIYQWFDGESWNNSERELYTVSNDGSYFTMVQLDEWQGDWMPYARALLEGSEGGMTYTEQMWSGSMWTNEFRVVVPNLSVPQLVAVLLAIEEMGNDQLGIFLPLAFIPDHTFEAWDGAGWLPEERQTSIRYYDSQSGALARVETIMEEYFDGAWEAWGRFVHTYDLIENDLLDLLELQDLEDEEWVTFFMEELAYTATARLASAELSIVFPPDLRRDRGKPEIFPVAMLTYVWEEAAVSTEGEASVAAFGFEAVFPNPISSQGLVRLHVGTAAALTVSVYDVLGRRVAVLVDGVLSEGRHDLQIDVSGLPSGAYVLRLRTPDGLASRPITVLR